ncbi:MAG: alpha/beta hydrolase [Cellvibrionales bacterium]|nr:alpha/beta hydrolase [Cellvibrionales bacterium]
MFDANAIINLPPFSPGNAQQPEIKAYLSFYQNDFAAKGLAESQSIGRLPLGGFSIFTHLITAMSAKGCVLLLHGYFDHSANLRPLTEYFLRRGFSVILFDLPGHGLSSGDKSVIHSFQEYQAVLEALIAYFKQQIDFPLSLIGGHSTGGAIAMQYILNQNTPDVEKLLLIAPLVEPIAWPWIKWQMAFASPFMQRIKRKFKQNTSNEDFWYFIQHKDPLQTQYVSVAWLNALKHWLKEDFAQATPKQLPVLMLQGTCDNTVNGKKNAKQLIEKFPQMRCQALKGAGHQLINESEFFQTLWQVALADFI